MRILRTSAAVIPVIRREVNKNLLVRHLHPLGGVSKSHRVTLPTSTGKVYSVVTVLVTMTPMSAWIVVYLVDTSNTKTWETDLQKMWASTTREATNRLHRTIKTMAIIIILSNLPIRCALAPVISILEIVEEVTVVTVAVTAKVDSHTSTTIHSLITTTIELQQPALPPTTTGKTSEYC